MCRFIAYRGKPILLEEVLHKPKNSLIRQSSNANEAEEPLNGDGFGVGWYMPELDPEPGLFVSVMPAWNDRNLSYLCRKVSTTCFFAHVRAASSGGVSEANCHPFHYKKFLFMHNGGIGGFQKLKRKIRHRLSDEIYDWVRGQTDSEHLFALFLENLKNRDADPSAEEMSEILQQTIQEIQKLKADYGITEACYINCVITNGKTMVGVRYVSDHKERPSTMYYSEGHHYECEDGICVMRPGNPDEYSVLIVSEKLTVQSTQWHEIPKNHLCIVAENMQVTTRLIDDGIVRESSDAIEETEQQGRGFRPTLVKA